jgi:hypothetical protein
MTIPDTRMNTQKAGIDHLADSYNAARYRSQGVPGFADASTVQTSAPSDSKAPLAKTPGKFEHHHVMNAWSHLRNTDSNVPDDVLDAMRDALLAVPATQVAIQQIRPKQQFPDTPAPTAWEDVTAEQLAHARANSSWYEFRTVYMPTAENLAISAGHHSLAGVTTAREIKHEL